MKYNVKRHAVEQPQDQSIKLIPLTQGMNAIVDAKNYERILRLNWCAQKGDDNRYYAMAKESTGDGIFRKVWMHREIFEYRFDLVDHADGNGLNNREENLRPCTSSQNSANRRTPKTNTSGYKGVTWFRCRQKWLCQGWKDRKRVHLGLFPNTEEGKVAGARAYDRFMIGIHGPFAKTNFSHTDYQ